MSEDISQEKIFFSANTFLSHSKSLKQYFYFPSADDVTCSSRYKFNTSSLSYKRNVLARVLIRPTKSYYIYLPLYCRKFSCVLAVVRIVIRQNLFLKTSIHSSSAHAISDVCCFHVAATSLQNYNHPYSQATLNTLFSSFPSLLSAFPGPSMRQQPPPCTSFSVAVSSPVAQQNGEGGQWAAPGMGRNQEGGLPSVKHQHSCGIQGL